MGLRLFLGRGSVIGRGHEPRNTNGFQKLEKVRKALSPRASRRNQSY